MALVAIEGSILALLAVYRHDLDLLAPIVGLALIVVVPAHLAIAANRRDDARSRQHSAHHDPDLSSAG